MIDAERMERAMFDAAAQSGEWRDAPTVERLEQIGLDPDTVPKFVVGRVRAYLALDGKNEAERVHAAYMEALLMGMRLGREQAD